MMIVSNIDGRIRIRDKQLRDLSTAENIRKALLEHPGVREVSVNRKVGSLLIFYDHESTLLKDLMDLMAKYVKAEDQVEAGKNIIEPSNASSPRTPLPALTMTQRKWIRRGMLGSLTITLLGAALDLKRFHVTAGFGFVGILGVHLFDKRRLLLR